MGTSSKTLAGKLLILARRQHGCFTAAQAIDVGYADSVHLYHVRTGGWRRVFRGVYRLASFPDSPDARCMAAILWTRGKNGKVQGVLAPETLTALRNGSLLPDMPIHILVDTHFRRSAPIPPAIHVSIAPKPTHKSSKKTEAPPAASHQAPAGAPPTPPPGVDAADFYDWLDFQSVRCRANS